ncbi:protein translocase subunit SecD [Candidatus Paracaedibacter symbiosus]|uniref:protein translocase subunit SecD n=1 Tax=Candidatus Paracaedibacter symbiosus TaxID=244582 RepID=UPI000509F509|nr:protein translocase subunit SecD [Candidatus Paracaedibacter symbiosus]
MIYIARWKVWLIISVCLFGILFSLPNMLSNSQLEKMPEWLRNTINLGLELRGGSHLQLEVDLKSVLKDQTNNMLDDVRNTLRKEKVGYTGLVLGTDKKSVTFVLRDPSQQQLIEKTITKLVHGAKITSESDGRMTVAMTPEMVDDRAKAAMEQSIEVIRHRIDESGTKEPLIQRQGSDRIIVQLPGVENPAEVKRLIGRTAKLSFQLVNEDVGTVPVDANGRPTVAIPTDTEALPETMHDGNIRYLAVKKQVSITGDHLVDARFRIEEAKPAVSIKFDAVGARKFAEISAQNLKRRFAIILDNKIISAPQFSAVIVDGNGVISGSFTNKEASELSLLLRAGALPAPLHVIEERTVGPSLGADSIHDGKIATICAFVLVALFMFANYSLFGLFADLALAFNLIILFAALSLLQATLTLPGIAGIALTIGMAVDANVLIYERIKEELRHGLRPVAAVETGYKRALTTIIDSNLTTLIGAAVLFEFGTGPIRGFAVTLALGIVISLFTSISLTRLFVVTWLRRQSQITNLPI